MGITLILSVSINDEMYYGFPVQD